MNDQFSIGEIAILIASAWPEYDGQDCEIIGGLEKRRFWGDRSHTFRKEDIRYRVAMADGHIFDPAPSDLRKKRLPPKREETGEWDLCPWQPKRKIPVT